MPYDAPTAGYGMSEGPAKDPTPQFTEEQIVKIAHVCHEANRAYCITLGDDSQPTWSEAPDWQRESVIDGVRKHLEWGNSPRLMQSSESHDLWMERKLRDGWRWGPVKDPQAKEHPSLLPYSALPSAERRKDVLFSRIVQALNPSHAP